jgi:hypothetical protein
MRQKYKFEVTGTILIAIILLVWKLQFMEIGGQWGTQERESLGKSAVSECNVTARVSGSDGPDINPLTPNDL